MVTVKDWYVSVKIVKVSKMKQESKKHKIARLERRINSGWIS